jgi:hypothetical protein
VTELKKGRNLKPVKNKLKTDCRWRLPDAGKASEQQAVA